MNKQNCLLCTIITCLFFTFSCTGFSQTIRVFGYIKDSLTGETLVGANVFCTKQKTGTISNNFGFYSLDIPAHQTVRIEISFVGYTTLIKEINAAKDSAMNFLLSGTTLKEVEITENKNYTVHHGELLIPIEKLKAVPTLAGEPDIIKALTLLPGISSGIEGTTGLYIRGGTPDQNLILLDGATVYNASHLFGFLSVFNPSAIKSVSVFKGGFPARYGGRLSSVLDITMKEGNNKKKNRELTIGSVTSSVLLEGPIKSEKVSYAISGRASYSSILAFPTKLFYAHQTNYFDFLIYDLNAKINFELSSHEKLFLSGYIGNDFFGQGDRTAGTSVESEYSWGNQTASFRYTNILGSKFFAQTLLNFNRYNFQINRFIKDDTSSFNRSELLKTSNVQDVSAKFMLDYNTGKHGFKIGIESALHRFQPDKLQTIIRGQQTIELTNPDTLIRSGSFDFFIEDDIKWSSQFSTNIGLRCSNYFTGNVTYSLFEPRLLSSFTIDEHNEVGLSLSRMGQPIHLLSVSTLAAPNDLWVPATKNVPIEKAWQAAVSYTKKFSNPEWLLEVEAYYKKMDDLIDYKSGVNVFSTDKNWQDLIEKNGIGRAYGAEIFLKKDGTKHSGWISYTLAWSERQFMNINKDAWYPQHYDRRHNLNIVYENKLSKKWTFNANFVFQTGYAISMPTVIYYDIGGLRTPFYPYRNNARAPIYQRLDIAFTYAYKTKRKRDAKLNLSLYNVYGYPNPFSVTYTLTGFHPSGTVGDVGYEGVVNTVTPFRFIPGISWSLKF